MTLSHFWDNLIFAPVVFFQIGSVLGLLVLGMFTAILYIAIDNGFVPKRRDLSLLLPFALAPVLAFLQTLAQDAESKFPAINPLLFPIPTSLSQWLSLLTVSKSAIVILCLIYLIASLVRSQSNKSAAFAVYLLEFYYLYAIYSADYIRHFFNHFGPVS